MDSRRIATIAVYQGRHAYVQAWYWDGSGGLTPGDAIYLSEHPEIAFAARVASAAQDELMAQLKRIEREDGRDD